MWVLNQKIPWIEKCKEVKYITPKINKGDTAMKQLTTLFTILVIVVAFTTISWATLIDRGGGMIYDTDLNITWLQDANYAKTSGYDDDGRMYWSDAMAWAENLVYGGYSNWRLPTTIQLDPSCSFQYEDGTNDFSSGYNCVGSEMGHLMYTELGNTAGESLVNTNPFINLQPFWYLSGTEFSPSPNLVWFFNFNDGFLSAGGKSHPDNYLYAWAIHPGDVATVSEPSTFLLFGLGIAGLIILFVIKNTFMFDGCKTQNNF